MSRPPDEELTRGFNTQGLDTRRSSSSLPAVRFALGLFHTEGGQVVPLTVGTPVTVGRTAPSSHPIPDSHLSRVHARFTLLEDGRVRVEDLGSTNGTWLAGRKIGSAEIGPGEAVQMGRVIAHVQPVGGAVPRADEGVAMVAGEGLREVMAMASRAAASRVPIVILGETGTGKEVLAWYVHEQSPRRAKPMVSINCAAIPSQLVESTLFGHEKGAFTGAAAQHQGVFEAADGGTVFLDEIGDLPAPAQAALLRVLETRRFARVGSVREIEVDVRVVAATHRDLEAMAAQGAFRPDLYYRLGTITLSLPPLRARPDDIEPLVRHFLRKAGGGRRIGAAALARLRAYAWPGNVRELKNAVERALVVSKRSVIEEGDLPERVLRASAPGTTTMAPATTSEDDVFAITSQIAIGPTGPVILDGPGQGDLRSHLHEQERRLLLSTYEATGYNRTETARRLGLPVRTLSHKMKILGIKRPER
jgi:DNA-binding NtrC family response regulator